MCLTCAVKGQKVSIPSLVNDIYKNQIKAERIDTVLFLNDCNNQFFVANTNQTNHIVVVFFASRDSMAAYASTRKECLVFKSGILEVGNKEMKLKVGLYRFSESNRRDAANLLFFVDERTISLALVNNRWRLSRTISIEDH
jgi:hypothetical protein